MKYSLKSYLRNLAKNHLLIFAFGFLGLLLLVGTVIINVFWSGCVTPSFANDNTTIKDYMTLYLSMLGVVATLYASFVVIYAYDAWKEQKNFETDVELLKECDENLCRFQNEIDFVCKKIIGIHDIYNSSKSYYLSHSIYRTPLELENKYLEDFNIHIKRYLDYNKHETRLAELVNEYYDMAKDLLYFNKDFTTNIYLRIYDELKVISNSGWSDTTIVYPYFSSGDPKEKLIENYFSILKSSYRNAGYLEELDNNSNKINTTYLNYKEFYDLMNTYNQEINSIIKSRMRA
ncbi:hypothetical protein [Acinetobacter nosocomialis]|uniref:hypothetical protein n=1 Tax=Acinetobacter nosocomialis TaxID=106654 RepID=UPI001A9B53A4|nr:hypothetical protein [Acinetobacter nosocomialis]MBO1280985.1 hypothetical protein [Acinetobacter nosocomialis]